MLNWLLFRSHFIISSRIYRASQPLTTLPGQADMSKSSSLKESKSLSISVASVSNTESFINKPLVVDDPSFSACTGNFRLDRHRQPRKWNQLQLSAETDRIKYRAINFGEHSAVTLPYRYAIAVVDTQENTAKLFDAELLVTRRIIKSVEEADNTQRPPLKVVSTADATLEYYKSKALLGESFGTKKTKQMLSSLDRNRIDMGQLETQSAFISKNLDSSINRIAEAKNSDSDPVPTEPSSVTMGSDSILPPHDTATRKVEEIYRMQDLIPSEVYYSLDVSPIVEAITQKQTEAFNTAISPYQLQETVLNRVKSLASLTSLPKSTSLTHTLRCLIYLNFLLTFRALNESKVNSDLSKFLPMATQDLLTALLGQFTEVLTLANGKTRHKVSSVCRDRLITFICIMVLTLDGFRTNVARLSTALQQPATKTVEYMRAVGCVIERPTADEPTKFVAPGAGREIAVKIAALKAPLTIVPAKTRGGPPRRK